MSETLLQCTDRCASARRVYAFHAWPGWIRSANGEPVLKYRTLTHHQFFRYCEFGSTDYWSVDIYHHELDQPPNDTHLGPLSNYVQPEPTYEPTGRWGEGRPTIVTVENWKEHFQSDTVPFGGPEFQVLPVTGAASGNSFLVPDVRPVQDGTALPTFAELMAIDAQNLDSRVIHTPERSKHQYYIGFRFENQERVLGWGYEELTFSDPCSRQDMADLLTQMVDSEHPRHIPCRPDRFVVRDFETKGFKTVDFLDQPMFPFTRANHGQAFAYATEADAASKDRAYFEATADGIARRAGWNWLCRDAGFIFRRCHVLPCYACKAAFSTRKPFVIRSHTGIVEESVWGQGPTNRFGPFPVEANPGDAPQTVIHVSDQYEPEELPPGGSTPPESTTWVEETTYHSGDAVALEDRPWTCIADHTASQENKPPNRKYWRAGAVGYYDVGTDGEKILNLSSPDHFRAFWPSTDDYEARQILQLEPSRDVGWYGVIYGPGGVV